MVINKEYLRVMNCNQSIHRFNSVYIISNSGGFILCGVEFFCCFVLFSFFYSGLEAYVESKSQLSIMELCCIKLYIIKH